LNAQGIFGVESYAPKPAEEYPLSDLMAKEVRLSKALPPVSECMEYYPVEEKGSVLDKFVYVTDAKPGDYDRNILKNDEEFAPYADLATETYMRFEDKQPIDYCSLVFFGDAGFPLNGGIWRFTQSGGKNNWNATLNYSISFFGLPPKEDPVHITVVHKTLCARIGSIKEQRNVLGDVNGKVLAIATQQCVDLAFRPPKTKL